MTALQQRVVDAIRDGVETNWALARELGYSQNTIRRVTGELGHMGIIAVKETFGGEKSYEVVPVPETAGETVGV